MRSLILPALALATMTVPATAAHAESWRLAGTISEYPALVAFIDADSLSRFGDSAQFTVRQFDEDVIDGWLDQKINAKCSTMTYTVLNTKNYDAGKLTSDSDKVEEVGTAPVGSVDEMMLWMACGKEPLPAATSDPLGYADDFFLGLGD